MTCPLVVLLSPTQAELYHWVDKRLFSVTAFSFDAMGAAALTSALRAIPSAPAVLLVDFGEEAFRLERLPHVCGDRNVIVERARKRLFGETDFCHSTHLRRDREGRRDDIVLFSALTCTETLTPWIMAFSSAGVPLKAIVSVPLLLASLLRRLCRAVPPDLLVVFFTPGGLRLIQVRSGGVVLNRLLPDRDPMRLQYHLQSTLQFLNRQEGHEQGAPLEVLLVGRAADVPAACEGGIRIHRIDEDAIRGHLPAHPGTLEFAFAREAALYDGHGYARPCDRREFVEWRQHGWLRAATLIIGVVSCVLALHLFASGHRDQLAAARSRNTAVLLEQNARVTGATEEARKLAHAVKTAEWLERHAPDPTLIAQEIDRAMVEFPSVRVDEMKWTVSTTRANPDQPLPFRAGGDSLLPDTIYETILLQGEVVASSSYRMTLEELERLVDKLKRLPSILTVEVVEYPWDLDPSHALSDTLSPAKPAARFSLRLLRGVTDNGRA